MPGIDSSKRVTSPFVAVPSPYQPYFLKSSPELMRITLISLQALHEFNHLISRIVLLDDPVESSYPLHANLPDGIGRIVAQVSEMLVLLQHGSFIDVVVVERDGHARIQFKEAHVFQIIAGRYSC